MGRGEEEEGVDGKLIVLASRSSIWAGVRPDVAKSGFISIFARERRRRVVSCRIPLGQKPRGVAVPVQL